MSKNTLGYTIVEGANKMDIDVIYQFIANSYWGKNRTKAQMQTAIEHSMCFGLFNDNLQQVGFARVVTDQAVFAYLADVFVLPEHRDKGLSKWLLKTILKSPSLKSVNKMLLTTLDAHGLYQQLGFTEIQNPDNLMEWLRN